MMKKKITIIGGGLSGVLLCNELVKEHKVILLEKGGKAKITFPVVHCINKKLAEVHTCCYGGGGTTNLWHNGLIPIRCEDLTNSEFKAVLADAGRYTDQVSSALYFGSTSFGAEHEKLVAEVNALSEHFSVFPHGIDCLVYPKSFEPLTVSDAVEAVYDVENVDFSFDGNRVKTVNYTVAGKKRTVDADIVIVCAGTLGTPKIVQQLISAKGLNFQNVGLGFIDHPMGFVGKARFSNDLSVVIKKLSSLDRGSYVSRNAVRLKSRCGNYTACAFFRPALTMENSLSIYKYKSSLGASSGMARLKNIFSFKLFHPDIIAEIVAHLFGVTLPSRTFNILFIAEQKRGGNRVFYEGEQLMVDWTISSDELAIYREMLIDLKEMLNRIADEVNIKTDITEDWLWSAAHHSCTTPMGGTDKDLIDTDLKLKFFENVFVCDGSVLQEHSYANTGLAIGQLAFRLAEKIKKDHGNP